MSSKKALLIVSFLLLIAAVTGQLYRIKHIEIDAKSANKTTNQVGIQDSLSFQSIENQQMKSVRLSDEMPTLLMYMDPTCDACIEMTDKIFAYYEEFENCKLIMITEADISQAIRFSETHNLKDKKNIDIVLDVNQVMYQHYGLIEYPSFIIYASNQEHIKTVDEYVTFPIVVKYVREAIAKSS